MKKILIIVILLIAGLSCKKEASPIPYGKVMFYTTFDVTYQGGLELVSLTNGNVYLYDHREHSDDPCRVWMYYCENVIPDNYKFSYIVNHGQHCLINKSIVVEANNTITIKQASNCHPWNII